ncbi:uncharacterized protein BDR25DRAFT_349414 [Lindgomyces ingoldianus]|uniref:Uncharacterized protein n=1 Tax=Lindgomyces ingoldianus TaxID=673940 RepID=A0ACB6RDB5_9PLEO|nr:uncharacterized protein BDR25DRAFT_349414 [Lindgomyces ingoldianus]KAF2476317.1 hypothetical protein BDR25DRAFT_349414 [Lindgomyces ingoldianus]
MNNPLVRMEFRTATTTFVVSGDASQNTPSYLSELPCHSVTCQACGSGVLFSQHALQREISLRLLSSHGQIPPSITLREGRPVIFDPRSPVSSPQNSLNKDKDKMGPERSVEQRSLHSFYLAASGSSSSASTIRLPGVTPSPIRDYWNGPLITFSWIMLLEACSDRGAASEPGISYVFLTEKVASIPLQNLSFNDFGYLNDSKNLRQHQVHPGSNCCFNALVRRLAQRITEWHWKTSIEDALLNNRTRASQKQTLPRRVPARYLESSGQLNEGKLLSCNQCHVLSLITLIAVSELLSTWIERRQPGTHHEDVERRSISNVSSRRASAPREFFKMRSHGLHYRRISQDNGSLVHFHCPGETATQPPRLRIFKISASTAFSSSPILGSSWDLRELMRSLTSWSRNFLQHLAKGIADGVGKGHGRGRSLEKGGEHSSKLRWKWANDARLLETTIRPFRGLSSNVSSCSLASSFQAPSPSSDKKKLRNSMPTVTNNRPSNTILRFKPFIQAVSMQIFNSSHSQHGSTRRPRHDSVPDRRGIDSAGGFTRGVHCAIAWHFSQPSGHLHEALAALSNYHRLSPRRYETYLKYEAVMGEQVDLDESTYWDGGLRLNSNSQTEENILSLMGSRKWLQSTKKATTGNPRCLGDKEGLLRLSLSLQELYSALIASRDHVEDSKRAASLVRSTDESIPLLRGEVAIIMMNQHIFNLIKSKFR